MLAYSDRHCFALKYSADCYVTSTPNSIVNCVTKSSNVNEIINGVFFAKRIGITVPSLADSGAPDLFGSKERSDFLSQFCACCLERLSL